MSLASFSLATRPWIPAWTAAGPVRLSLREALTRAHEVRLSGPPEEHTVVLRLLLAVYGAAARPADSAQWDAAWHADALDTACVDAYLDAYADRFDLFSTTHPFGQSAGLSASDANRDGRVLELASWGSGTAHFAARLLHDQGPMDPADAAIGLLLLQAWHPGGIQSGHPTDPATRGNRVYGGKPGLLSTLTHLRITGASLKDEVLLNLPVAERADGDSPVWERDSPPAPMAVREAAGPLDVWTWPTRRVRLIPDESGRVSAVAVYDGDRLTDPAATGARWDPGAALGARGGRLALTDSAGHLLPWAPAALLPTTDTADTTDTAGAAAEAGGVSGGRCAVVDHVVAAAERGTLAPDMAIEAALVRSEHTTAHRAALSGLTHLAAPIGPAAALGDPRQRAALAAAARWPGQVQRALTRTAAEAFHLLLQAAQSRAELSIAAHLGGAWQEFTQDPAGGEDAWRRALEAAVEQTAGPVAGRGRLMALARVATAARTALAQSAPSPVPQGDH
ncbi:type I-E CRISPR-associated protein Cse1/CasA [Streptomyces sp. NPDC053474]|uniref:type I-E CRISPR-associated protein Cse1/CasA n=1 Tax=Streptomyces sp. NPDC053474 TaxID=3365704 RepID=UPI0037D16176